MLLRSSSTPVLGSLLPSFSDSPNHNNCNHYETNNIIIKHPPPTIPQNHNNRFSLHQTGPLNLSPFSCNSSPISPSIADLDRNKGFRRAQSDGNLEGLAYASCSTNEDQYIETNLPKKFSARPKCTTLQTIQSFSFYNSKGEYEDEEDEEESDREDDDEEEREERVMAMRAQTLSLENKMNSMILTEEVNVKDQIWNMGIGDEKELLGQGMFLAIGIGIGGASGGGGGNGGRGHGGGSGDFNSGEDNQGVEEYYKRMVEENPGNPLFLRNYAQFLYQSKRDLQGAEECYSRAILADPKDGEILSQYAKLIWELHHDQDRALSYFERAVQASPEDSHVQAAYASFLWDTEEYEECDMPKDVEAMPSQFHGAVASASA